MPQIAEIAMHKETMAVDNLTEEAFDGYLMLISLTPLHVKTIWSMSLFIVCSAFYNVYFCAMQVDFVCFFANWFFCLFKLFRLNVCIVSLYFRIISGLIA